MSGLERIIGRSADRSIHGDTGDHWLSISDLMAGLMMVFLFVSIALMRDAMIERDKIREIAVTYQENQAALYEALMDEFEDDLERWDAAVDRESLSFRFRSPDVLFDTGKSSLKPRFREILDNFFPRYLAVLLGFRDSIDEVRVEGHTSSIWNDRVTASEAYFNNMALSQGRTRAVLEYVYALPEDRADRAWVKEQVAAVGFSSSRPILNADGSENLQRSRRVSFRVITNAETQIRRILEQ
jgi:outer membrane protein OmpA-like peptidoglycan-associated protein